MVKESEFTIADVALNYVRNHPNTDSVVFGVESLNQLTEIISINKHNEINPEVIKEEFSGISSRLIDPRYWG
jgi:aryl-alcohol dehydrogenase-like predicted oxidoreductase